jgi:GT2 family glycosyltransferase
VDVPSVSIVTATTGHPGLRRCLASVQGQSYPRIDHLLVVDGPEHTERVEAALRAVTAHRCPLRVIALPHATGRDGHRVYAASTFLVDTDYVAFLDEDHWLDPDHVESLVSAVTDAGADWGFALRKVATEDGEFDDESDGGEHPVGVSCHLLRTEAAVRVSPLWYERCRAPGGPSPP